MNPKHPLAALTDAFPPLFFALLLAASGLVPATSAQAPPLPPLVAAAAFASPVIAGSATLFSDNFDDNLLDATKWTIANRGYDTGERNQRLEMTVREQQEAEAIVRSSAISRSFSASSGVDANVNQRAHAAGAYYIAQVRFRIERSDDQSKWVEIILDPPAAKVTLHDSSSNVHTLASVTPIGYHALRLVVTGSTYTGYYDGTSFQVSSTLFSGAGGVKIEFFDSAFGTTSAGATETAARDDAIVYAYTVGSPGAPQNLRATPGPGKGNLQLTWQPPVVGDSAITNYNIYRGEISGDESFVTSVSNTLSWTDSGLPDGTPFYYYITAANSAGQSPTSNEATATTYQTPSAPTLQATSGNPDASGVPVALSWSTPSSTGGSAITGYTLERGPTTGAEAPYQNLGNVHSYNDHCPAATNCYYVVHAVNIVGPGPASNEVSYKSSPADPGGICAESSCNPSNASGVPMPAYTAPAADGKGFIIIPWGEQPLVRMVPTPDAQGKVAILFELFHMPGNNTGGNANLRALDPLGTVLFDQSKPAYFDEGFNSAGLVYFEAIPTQGVANLQFRYGNLHQDVNVDPNSLGDVPDTPCRLSDCLDPCDAGCSTNPCTYAPATPVVCGPLPPPPNVQVCDQPVVKDEPPCKPVPPPPCDPSEDCVCPAGGTSCVTDKLPCGTAGKPSCQSYVCGTSGCNIEVCPGGGTSCVTDKVPCGTAGKPSCQSYACGTSGCNIEVCQGGGIACLTGQAPCGTAGKPSCQDYVCSGDTCNINVCHDGGINCLQLCPPTCLDFGTAKLDDCSLPTCYEIKMPLTMTTASSNDGCHTVLNVDGRGMGPVLSGKQKNQNGTITNRPMMYTSVAWAGQASYRNTCQSGLRGVGQYYAQTTWIGPALIPVGTPFDVSSAFVYHGSALDCTDSGSNQDSSYMFGSCGFNTMYSMWVRPDSYAIVPPNAAEVKFNGVSNVTLDNVDQAAKYCHPTALTLVTAYDLLIGAIAFEGDGLAWTGAPVGMALTDKLHKQACDFDKWKPTPIDTEKYGRIGNGILVGKDFDGGVSLKKQFVPVANVNMKVNNCFDKGYSFQTMSRSEWQMTAWTPYSEADLPPQWDGQAGDVTLALVCSAPST